MKKQTLIFILSMLVLALGACKGDDKGKEADKGQPEKVEKAQPVQPEDKAEPKKALPEEEPEGKQPADEAAPPEGEGKVEPAPVEQTEPEESIPPLSQIVGDLAPLLPDDALFVAALSVPGMTPNTAALLDIPFVNLAPEWGIKLIATYQEFFKMNTGLDINKIDAVVVFVSAQQYVGILVLGDTTVGPGSNTTEMKVGERKAFGIPQLLLTALPSLREAGGTALFVDEEHATRYAKWVLSGEKAMKPETWQRFAKGLDAEAGAWFAGVVDMNNPFIALAWASGIPLSKPDLISISFTSSVLKIAVEANQGSVDGILGFWELGRTSLKNEIAKGAARLDEADLIAGLGMVGAPETIDIVFDAFKPVRTEKGLELKLDMGLPGVSTIGVSSILAVVAIPAFIKYMRRAKTAEAIDELDKLYKAVAMYVSTPRVDSQGNLIPCDKSIPEAPLTPATTCCQSLGGPDKDGDDRCDPDPGGWQNEAWTALHFEITEPHYFVYSVAPSDYDGAPGFVITAHGDLDCDGIQSTFQRFGKITVEDGECSVNSAAALYTENETE